MRFLFLQYQHFHFHFHFPQDLPKKEINDDNKKKFSLSLSALLSFPFFNIFICQDRQVNGRKPKEREYFRFKFSTLHSLLNSLLPSSPLIILHFKNSFTDSNHFCCVYRVCSPPRNRGRKMCM